jgi:hypothetical protein
MAEWRVSEVVSQAGRVDDFWVNPASRDNLLRRRLPGVKQTFRQSPADLGDL